MPDYFLCPGQFSLVMVEHDGDMLPVADPHSQVLVRQAQMSALLRSVDVSTRNSFSSRISPWYLFLDLMDRLLWTYHMMAMMAPTRHKREKPHPRLEHRALCHF